MKRTAAEAFAPAAGGVFKPDAAAMFDPKAYFAQWQQAAFSGQAMAAPGPQGSAMATAGAMAPAPGEKSELVQQLEAASAVRCAAIVKEKGQNFTLPVAIEALSTMATKSSFKLREELLKQKHVRGLCDRVQKAVQAPPPGLTLELLARASWCLMRFPDEVLVDSKVTFAAVARMLASAAPTEWHSDVASKILWVLAKADIIGQYKHIASQVVKELIRDMGRRVAEPSHEALIDLLWSVARARRHIRAGDHQTVHVEANDEQLFDYAAKRIANEIEQIDVRLLAEVAHTHAEIGIKDAKLFQALCPKIMAKQKDLNEATMARVIKAYARFMLPLKEEAQGFRTMAVVSKGDFIRPSEKPKREGKKTYDHPVALFDKTQVHARA